MRFVLAIHLMVFLICYVNPVFAITLSGSGGITVKQQRELETYINYFGRASVFVKEYCYFDEKGNPINKGKCIAEVPNTPHYAAGSVSKDYTRQFRGTPLGKQTANPKMEIYYLHSFPEVWMACNNRRAYGCTLTHDWPDFVTIFLTSYDKKLGNITLTHEIEFHAKRDIQH